MGLSSVSLSTLSITDGEQKADVGGVGVGAQPPGQHAGLQPVHEHTGEGRGFQSHLAGPSLSWSRWVFFSFHERWETKLYRYERDSLRETTKGIV
jgi:hypothetical protein